ncbi:TIGR03747 family integrating conjugative element membrane protein [Proteus terrae]|uniref:TIGR03747 family integrating conjugative element membrane protein n=1 Tax=Proteus terrae TaxID=1574161 RepID=UPI00217E12C2|nr:TIGR03747 family integrating conjugative element membrane protein [Proteus terrae]MCS6715460.1 TIGR03747 family integrating conjugative element membrane protein [Proteus terrae]MCS6733118.1 TIGR03747 family integrating conjugative element membrane protein [Proteus terrae]
MSQINTSSTSSLTSPKRRGFFTTLLWDIPWQIIGVLLASLLFSLILEYIGIFFFWAEEGAQHSYQIMLIERTYFAESFTQSVFLSSPVITGIHWITAFSQGMQDSLLKISLSAIKTDNGVTDGINLRAIKAIQAGKQYLLATFFVLQIVMMRVTILVLSIPLFILVIIVNVVDGLVRRDLRRYGAAYESSFLYHHAKRIIKPAIYIPCVLYLSLPFAVYPNFLLLPSTLLIGFAISVTVGSFKKYL